MLSFTVPAGHPAGDVPALGRLTINEAQGVNQQWVVWGCETNDAYDITAATASLFYEAESRALLNGTATATLAGASGAATNNTALTIGLPPTSIPVWSTRTPASVHLTHVGTFRVFARVSVLKPATGNVSLRFDWGAGDLGRYTSNATTTIPPELAGTYRIVDLGLVTIPPAVTGPQRWEGRVIASAVSTDRLYIDHFWLVPTIVSGEAVASAQAPASTVLSVFDAFDQVAGSLTGKVAPFGAQTWTFLSGDTDDWTVDASLHAALRSATSDAGGGGALNSGRHLTAGTVSYSTVTVSTDIMYSVTPHATNVMQTGITFRAIDANNFGRIVITYPSAIGFPFLRHYRRITGSVFSSTSGLPGSDVRLAFTGGSWYTMTVSVDSTGRVRVWWNVRGASLGTPAFDFVDSSYAAGGPLASGKVGLYDDNEGGEVISRAVDNFTVFSTAGSFPPDAALFASQSLEVRSDAVVREDATGTVWQPVFYEGDHLQVPPTGREKRLVRFIVKASRSAPGQGEDAGIDDINATLAVTPRYLSVPSP